MYELSSAATSIFMARLHGASAMRAYEVPQLIPQSKMSLSQDFLRLAG